MPCTYILLFWPGLEVPNLRWTKFKYNFHFQRFLSTSWVSVRIESNVWLARPPFQEIVTKLFRFEGNGQNRLSSKSIWSHFPRSSQHVHVWTPPPQTKILDLHLTQNDCVFPEGIFFVSLIVQVSEGPGPDWGMEVIGSHCRWQTHITSLSQLRKANSPARGAMRKQWLFMAII